MAKLNMAKSQSRLVKKLVNGRYFTEGNGAVLPETNKDFRRRSRLGAFRWAAKEKSYCLVPYKQVARIKAWRYKSK